MGDAQLGHTILDLIPRDQTSLTAIQAHGTINRLIDYRTSKGQTTKALRLSFGTPPRDVKIGFLVGNTTICDLIFNIPPTNVPWRFAITFNTKSGIPVVENLSPAGLYVGNSFLNQVGNRRVIEKYTYLSFGQYVFTARVTDRGRHQDNYQAQLGRYLGYTGTADTAIITKTYSKPLVVKDRIDQYLEIETVGSGGFGEVSLLVGKWTGHMFAVKKFKNPGNPDGIHREVSTLKNLRHNNIVSFVGCVYDNNRSICLIMEYLSYGHLCDFHVPAYCAIEIMNQCLDGLNYIHQNGIIHRDIKPNNVVLRSLVPIHACIIDFGIATLGNQAPQIMGTITFIPPEVWAGHPPSPTIDIWCLGLTGLHLFSKFPDEAAAKFCARHSANQFQAYVGAIFRRTAILAPVVRAFFEGMLAQNPAQRWSAAQCLNQIRPVQQFLMTRTSTGRPNGSQGAGGFPAITPRHVRRRSRAHARRSSWWR